MVELWSFPSLSGFPRSVRLWRWTAVLFGRAGPSGPHLPLIAGATGAHNPVGLGSPDQGASQGSNGPLGPLVERSILTFSPLISSFKFITLYFEITLFKVLI